MLTEYEKAEAAIDELLDENKSNFTAYLDKGKNWERLDAWQMAQQAGTIKRGYRLYCVGSDLKQLKILLIDSAKTRIAWLACNKIFNDCLEAGHPIPPPLLKWVNEVLEGERTITGGKSIYKLADRNSVVLALYRSVKNKNITTLAGYKSDNRKGDQDQSIAGIIAKKLNELLTDDMQDMQLTIDDVVTIIKKANH